MGEFLAVSAFRTEHADQVMGSVERYVRTHGWRTEEVVGGSAYDYKNHVLQYAPVDGWTVLLWPTYFTDVPAAAFVSGELGVLASTAHIHDGDYWAHTLLRDGTILDRFASMVDYFTDDPAVVADLKRGWSGDPAVVASAIGRPVDDLRPYLVHIALGDDEEEDPVEVKAFPDDRFTLEDAWVFVDFWRRLGITYPADVDAFAGRLGLAEGWFGKLPEGAEGDL
ncbi:hypothetical protein Ais01nite_44080 [Asanoa ishikariensis]|uniref:Uncharacterized protein n=1 Tax=Asanoa ishikariensis TaxID=137265 RepID=A0A1H3MW71_9ACTN|nr:hypothetical protein [Asanoa ishikariensis]GIF66373.1 hypothetical protein Ais01nite_44080 [Asanoa ishikariensis]SDY80743.1 hypothetical protein SAMN05421684_1653 [Asanoa ishikariensis]